MARDYEIVKDTRLTKVLAPIITIDRQERIIIDPRNLEDEDRRFIFDSLFGRIVKKPGKSMADKLGQALKPAIDMQGDTVLIDTTKIDDEIRKHVLDILFARPGGCESR